MYMGSNRVHRSPSNSDPASVISVCIGTFSVRPAAGRRASPEPIIHRLAALEARLDGVPVFDSRFAHAPAEKNDFLVETEGKIEQTRIKVLNLHSNGVDFGNALPNPLQMRLHLRALLRHPAEV